MRLFILALTVFLVNPAVALEEKHPNIIGAHKEDYKDAHPKDSDHSEEDEHHEEEAEVSLNVGPDKAVIAADPKKGLQLSPEAIRRIKLEKTQLTSAAPFRLPQEAILRSGVESAVYRLREGWYKSVHGSVRYESGKALFTPEQSNELRSGDEIALRPVAILRLAELDAFSSGEEGHGH